MAFVFGGRWLGGSCRERGGLPARTALETCRWQVASSRGRVRMTGGDESVQEEDSEEKIDVLAYLQLLASRDLALENSNALLPSHAVIRTDVSGEPIRDRFVYVDEPECIGCSHCAMTARNTFYLEPEHGRARAFQQDRDPEPLIEEAIDTCPVNCIYYVPLEELIILEGERESQKINNKARLVGGSGNERVRSRSRVLSSANMRCENCPKRGCQMCPLYGVGENPVYQTKKAEREARAEQDRRLKDRRRSVL